MRTRGRLNRWALTLGALGLLALAAASAWAQDECATCHEDVVKSFAKTPHGRAYGFDTSYKDAGCTSCHGSGQEHVNAGGEGKILNPAKAKAADSNSACMSCHEARKAQAHWQGSPHEAAGVKCASCHSVHATAPPARQALATTSPITEKCLACHGSLRKGLNQRSTHPLREGQMDCTSCHNPHGTPGEKLLVGDSINDTCYRCHAEKRGPFLWEHSPVREDCRTCHVPHGSNHPGMLQARTTQMCQACHQQGRHQTLPGLPAAIWNTNKQCVNCHSQIHGSNHPSGPLFQR